jgi:hypothetical protein
MLKTLLYINEDLASSIALRYTAYLNKFVPLSLYVTHVVEQTEKEQAGTGLVRRAWEDGIASSGEQLINRMLRTENIDCPLAGRPKVVMGNRMDETNYELRSGGYKLFIEGYLNTADPDQFYEVISSPLYTNAPCPTLMVKNLSISKKCAMLCASSVDPKILVEKSMKILGDSTFKFDIVYFKYKDNEQLQTLGKEEGGSNLQELESLMEKAGKSVENISVLSGAPEQVGDYLKQYALVVSTLPTRKSMRMQVLANSLAAVLIVR